MSDQSCKVFPFSASQSISWIFRTSGVPKTGCAYKLSSSFGMNLKSVTIRLGIFSGVEPFDFSKLLILAHSLLLTLLPNLLIPSATPPFQQKFPPRALEKTLRRLMSREICPPGFSLILQLCFATAARSRARGRP